MADPKLKQHLAMHFLSVELPAQSTSEYQSNLTSLAVHFNPRLMVHASISAYVAQSGDEAGTFFGSRYV